MKIALLQDDYPPHHGGGAGTVVYNLAQGFARDGHEVLVVTAVAEKKYAGEAVEGAVRVVRIYSNYAERWRAYRSLYNSTIVSKLADALKKFEPDVVHIHNVHYHLSYYSIIIARRFTKKVFLTAHDVMLFHYGKLTEFIDHTSIKIPGSVHYKISALQQWKKFGLRYNPLRNFCIRWYLQYVEGVIAVSHALKDALEQNGIAVLAVVYNGIDAQKWEADAKTIVSFKEKNRLGEVSVVLYAGATNQSKGWPQTLAAMEKVLQKHPNALLLLIGKNNTQTVPHFVRRAGWLSGEEMQAAYYASTVVLQPSLCLETFGLTALEGMTAGKPVVGTCFGGVPEVIEDGVTGYVVNPLNGELFGEKIAKLLSDSNVAAHMGIEGKKRAIEKFSLKAQVQNYEDLFNTIR